jgi:hypothetical protein
MTTPKIRANLNLSRSFTQVRGANMRKITKATLYLNSNFISVVTISVEYPNHVSDTLYTIKASWDIVN